MVKHTYEVSVKIRVELDADEPEPELNNPEVNRRDAFEVFKDCLEDLNVDDPHVKIEEI